MSDAVRSYLQYTPKLGQRVLIDPSSVVIGDVDLADDVSIWPLVAIRGDVNAVKIGARSNIQDGSVLHVTHRSEHNPDGYPLLIGEDVTVGHKAMLHGCAIGNRVLVGMGSILLDGAVIEDDVMIGAGSLVAPGKRLASGYLYMGSPARQIRPLTAAELEGLLYSSNNYVRWKDEYLSEDIWTAPVPYKENGAGFMPPVRCAAGAIPARSLALRRAKAGRHAPPAPPAYPAHRHIPLPPASAPRLETA